MKGRKKQYKTDARLYILLIAISIVFVMISFAFTEKFFTVIVGLGCSLFASVVIAWLIDISTCSQKEKTNKLILNEVFGSFDSRVKYELNNLLSSRAKSNQDIDLDKCYTVREIEEIVSNDEHDCVIWETTYNNIGEVMTSIDTSLLLSYNPTQQHMKLFSYLQAGINNHTSYKEMCKCTGTDRKMAYSMARIFLISELEFIASIYSLRNIELKCNVLEDRKEYIQSFRRCIKKS